jgi:hypothetical protein
VETILTCLAVAAFFGLVSTSIRLWYRRLVFLERMRVYNANMATQGHVGDFDLAACNSTNKLALAAKWRYTSTEDELIQPGYMGNEAYWETVYAYRKARRGLNTGKWVCAGLFVLVSFRLRNG